MKIKIEDLEFELDDYRTGKINQRRRNLSCVSESENNYKEDYTNKKKNKNENNIINNSNEKPIYVNSNNNYLITKLRKENENLRIKLSKYEKSNRFKPTETKLKEKKIENNSTFT